MYLLVIIDRHRSYHMPYSSPFSRFARLPKHSCSVIVPYKKAIFYDNLFVMKLQPFYLFCFKFHKTICKARRRLISSTEQFLERQNTKAFSVCIFMHYCMHIIHICWLYFTLLYVFVKIKCIIFHLISIS